MNMMKDAVPEKAVNNLLVGLLIQSVIVLLGVRIVLFYVDNFNTTHVLISLIAVFNFGVVIIVSKWLYKTQFLHEELKETINVMRSERHDFVNHMINVYGLVLSDNKNSAIEYLNDLNLEYRFNTEIISVSNPYLRVLLQNKSRAAAANGIDFKLRVNSQLKNFNMKSSSITTLFGNLIDNAIESVKNASSKKVIDFIINESNDSYEFTVNDSGPQVSDDILNKVDEEGFSTKGSCRGYGMSLIKDVVERNNGQVVYNKDPKGFTIILPMK